MRGRGGREGGGNGKGQTHFHFHGEVVFVTGNGSMEILFK